MELFTGILNYTIRNTASKSEGYFAILTDIEGHEYILYRKNIFEINDNFFKQFDGEKICIKGTLEPTGLICVDSVILSNNQQISTNNIEKCTENSLEFDFSNIKIEGQKKDTTKPYTDNKVNSKKKHLPRKLKKRNKKQIIKNEY